MVGHQVGLLYSQWQGQLSISNDMTINFTWKFSINMKNMSLKCKTRNHQNKNVHPLERRDLSSGKEIMLKVFCGVGLMSCIASDAGVVICVVKPNDVEQEQEQSLIGQIWTR